MGPRVVASALQPSFHDSDLIALAGSGVLVALGTGVSGRVPLTEIHDKAVLNALKGLRVGQAVHASVLRSAAQGSFSKKEGRQLLLLSLRSCNGGAVAGFKHPKAAGGDATMPVSLQAGDLSANQQVSLTR